MSRRNKKVSQTKNKKGDQPGQAKRRIRRRYTDRERRSAVKDVAQLGLSGAARKHDIATSTLHAWTKSPRWTDGAPPSESDGGTSSARRGRFTAEDRKHAIGLVASGMKRAQVARELGASQETIRLWVRAAEADGSMPTPTRSVGATSKATKGATSPPVSTTSAPFDSPPAKSLYAPRDPGQGLSDVETAAILELKKKHPSMGPAQIRAQLKRFRGWRVSIKAIARVLRNHGYESVHRGSRPQGPEPIRFEAPRRNALWQLDYAQKRCSAGSPAPGSHPGASGAALRWPSGGARPAPGWLSKKRGGRVELTVRLSFPQLPGCQPRPPCFARTIRPKSQAPSSH